jgi:flagellar biosynthetic protein FliR
MSFLHAYLLNQFLVFTLVLARISGLVMTAPIYGSQSVPMRIRALLAVTISLLLLPTAATRAAFDYPGTTLNYMVFLGGEIAVGLCLGLGITILFTGIQVAGQIIGQLSGMSLADVFDPAMGNSSPVFSQLMFYVALAVFMLINGHRVVMKTLLDTFVAIPAGRGGVADSVFDALVTILAQAFVVGIRAAAPVMTALLLATLIMGLLSRTLPQLNILSFGFGLNALLVQGALLFSLGGIVWAFGGAVDPVLELLQEALLKDHQLLHG